VKRSRLGVIPRAIGHVFEEIERTGLKCTVYVSFLQIYNEQVYDMLGRGRRDGKIEKGLRIREDRGQGTFVENLTEYIVTDKD
jgi:hypothetical protein